MRAITIFAILIPTIDAFVPTHRSASAPKFLRLRMASSDEILGDTTTTKDIEHAKYCTDHFGECSLEEMERLRSGEFDACAYTDTIWFTADVLSLMLIWSWYPLHHPQHSIKNEFPT